MQRLSVTRILLYAVLANWALFGVVHGKIDLAGAPLDGQVAHPPVRQMAYPPNLFRAVDDPPPRHDGAIHIAWVSASPALYGIGDPNAKPGFLQEPVAAELSKRLGLPVKVEAYALLSAFLLEKLQTTHWVLRTRPDMIVLSLDHFDFANRWISLPMYGNFRTGLLARDPLAAFQEIAAWPYLHASEIGWAGATIIMPMLRFRFEIGLHLGSWLSVFDPIAAEKVAGSPATVTSPIFMFDALYPYNIFLDGKDPEHWRIGNEALIDELLHMIQSADIPAFVYVDPTPVLARPTLIGLEAALRRFHSTMHPDSLLRIEPRALNQFLAGFDFLDSEHLRHPDPAMTEYLVDQLDALYRRRIQGEGAK